MFDLKRALQRLLPRRQPRRPLELTVVDQWALRSLFLVDGMGEDSIVAMVLDERPTVIPHEIPGALRKLTLFGFLERDAEGRYRLRPQGKKLKGIVPERPGVNMTYYG